MVDRYHYAQILLYRPALSCLSKLQSNNSAQTTAGDREIMNSFAQECLAQFARKGLQAAIHTVDLLLTCQGSGTGLVAPVRNFTPMCFCENKPCRFGHLAYIQCRSLQRDAGDDCC